MKNNKIGYKEIKKSNNIHKKIFNIFVYIFLSIWALFVLFPFYWMILTSIKGYGEYNSEYIPKFFTNNPTFQNYIDAFNAVPLGQYLCNTLIFTVLTTIIMMVVIILAAYAFSALSLRERI